MKQYNLEDRWYRITYVGIRIGIYILTHKILRINCSITIGFFLISHHIVLIKNIIYIICNIIFILKSYHVLNFFIVFNSFY